MKVKLKICGMKFPENILEISALDPDFFGFIFYENSARNYTEETIISLPKTIKKVGVFVNEKQSVIIKKIKTFELDFIQLHGNESESYCLELINQLNHNQLNTEIIKAFSVADEFDFTLLNKYQIVDYFLFDTKGKFPGGNGTTFNWQILENYPLQKPYFLSGGIGLNEVSSLQNFLQTKSATYCYALDVNSQFEIEAGLKNKQQLQQFKTQIYESV